MKIWYFKNIYRDESNDFLNDIIYLCILVKKYGQNKLGQNKTFSNGSSITEWKKYYSASCHIKWAFCKEKMS